HIGGEVDDVVHILCRTEYSGELLLSPERNPRIKRQLPSTSAATEDRTGRQARRCRAAGRWRRPSTSRWRRSESVNHRACLASRIPPPSLVDQSSGLGSL